MIKLENTFREIRKVETGLESRMEGKDFAQGFGGLLKNAVLGESPDSRIDIFSLSSLSKLADYERRNDGENTFEAFSVKEMDRLVSLVARRVLLDVITDSRVIENRNRVINEGMQKLLNQVVVAGGGLPIDLAREYNRLEGEIARQVDKVNFVGLPSDYSLPVSVGSFDRRVVVTTRDRSVDTNSREPVFTWKIPRLVKRVGGPAAGAVIVASCAGSLPTDTKPNFDPTTIVEPAAIVETVVPATKIPTPDLISEFDAVPQTLSNVESERLTKIIQKKLLAYENQGRNLVQKENEAACNVIEKYIVSGIDEITLCKTIIDGEEMVIGITDIEEAVELLPLVTDRVRVYGVWLKDNKVVASNTSGAAFVPFIGRGANGNDYIYSEMSKQYHQIFGSSRILEDLGVDKLLEENAGGTLVQPQTIRFDNGAEYVLTPEGDWIEKSNPLTSLVQADFEKYGLAFDPERFIPVEKGDKIVVTDAETGKLVYESLLDGSEGGFDINWIRVAIAEQGLVGGPSMEPNYRNKATGELYHNPGLVTDEVMTFASPLARQFRTEYKSEYGVSPYSTEKVSEIKGSPILVDSDNLLWGVVVGEKTVKTNNQVVYSYLIYRPDENNTKVEWIPLIPFSPNSVDLYP